MQSQSSGAAGVISSSGRPHMASNSRIRASSSWSVISRAVSSRPREFGTPRASRRGSSSRRWRRQRTEGLRWWPSGTGTRRARPKMIASLDKMRAHLEDLGGGLGVTDPVSRDVVLELKT